MDTSRQILHVDQNSFYASCEAAFHPEYKTRPMAVGGHPETRHGIILSPNALAKAAGVKTAETLWQAKQKCPELIIVHPNYPLYARFSKLAQLIYYSYTNRVEPFGPDECWIDITGSLHLFGRAEAIATEIRQRVKDELGLTASVGISWNKIFAKFGSDYSKPDATTIITPDNYQKIVWGDKVRSLLYVGRQTEKKLHAKGIYTIGELAHTKAEVLQKVFGKIGLVLHRFANGLDESTVNIFNETAPQQFEAPLSYGNGLTTSYDIVTHTDAKALLQMLSSEVGRRMRRDQNLCKVIAIGVRSADLTGYTRQSKLTSPTDSTRNIYNTCWNLLTANQAVDKEHPIRQLSVRCSDLIGRGEQIQTNLFTEEKVLKFEQIDQALDEIERKFGKHTVNYGTESASAITASELKNSDVIRPTKPFGKVDLQN